MKKLILFILFDWLRFAKDKRFVCTGCSDWKDYDTGELLGTKVDSAIVSDHTDYGDPMVSNLYEKVTFKVAKKLDIPLNVEIQPKGVVATVYGDYRNQLSCTAEDISVISKG